MSWIRWSAGLGAAGVLLGAFGAHALRGSVSERLLAAYQTGVLYHLVHAVALLALALHGTRTERPIKTPAMLFSAGILLFSGSLYAMAATGFTRLGAVTPIGGLLLVAGWIALAWRLG